MRISKLPIFGFVVALQVVALDPAALSLKLDILNPTVKLGDKIRIRVTITNVSDHAVSFQETNPYCNYSLKVVDSLGNTVPPTEFMKQQGCESAKPQNTNRNILVVLKPGQSANWEMEITEICQIIHPENYSVEVDRTFSGIGLIKSNISQVTVTP